MYIYQLFLKQEVVAVSRTVCSLAASIFPVPLAHDGKLGVFTDPPGNQHLPCVGFALGPVGDNLKMQFKER